MADLSVADVLDRAADLIEPEGAWTQGVIARNAKGHATFVERNACSFCADGAIRMVSHGGLTKPFEPALRVLSALLRKEVGTWNDRECRRQPQVVAKLREAAALARKEAR